MHGRRFFPFLLSSTERACMDVVFFLSFIWGSVEDKNTVSYSQFCARPRPDVSVAPHP